MLNVFTVYSGNCFDPALLVGLLVKSCALYTLRLSVRSALDHIYQVAFVLNNSIDILRVSAIDELKHVDENDILFLSSVPSYCAPDALLYFIRWFSSSIEGYIVREVGSKEEGANIQFSLVRRINNIGGSTLEASSKHTHVLAIDYDTCSYSRASSILTFSVLRRSDSDVERNLSSNVTRPGGIDKKEWQAVYESCRPIVSKNNQLSLIRIKLHIEGSFMG